MAGSKHSRALTGSYSSQPIDDRFLEAADEEAYHRYKTATIAPPKVLNHEILNYEVPDLFVGITLQFLVIIAFPFNSKLLFEFFVSLEVNSEGTALQSYVCRWPVAITY
ncbi:hypothetical protein M5K25_003791 [Dendrobium thyrsiflorum]|uniref:Uncharacterized protein n=1 Tax=Dendrobium thyrsiflorum TaxID=117978 RepID=A0ABD0VK00_DENTH